MDCVLRKSICSSQDIEPLDELAIPPRFASRKTGIPAVFVECWLDYAVTNGLMLWVWQSKTQGKEGCWRKCSIDIIKTALPFYDWVLVYEKKSYTSPSQLKAQGWDNCRNTPELPDDELHWEVHLDMGCGTDLNSGDVSRIYFCACNEVPRT